jgi:exodeoxyribonuclease I
MQPSFYWYDYETFGLDARASRPAQFAGLRTTLELEVVGEPTMVYCQPGPDDLPELDACLVHGITPQHAAERGLSEFRFAEAVHAELSAPGTCSVGYNSMRFDHELSRFLFYRNLEDPYAWAFRNRNSRWDLIDALRAACALRPEGISWPERESGAPSFRLEHLADANGIKPRRAHDALSDVETTIAVARLLRGAQARLFDYALSLADKARVRDILKLGSLEPVVHTTARYPAQQRCTSLVLPLGRHPTNANAVIAYDLRHDPEPFLELGVEALSARLFKPRRELAERDEAPLPVKLIHVNKAPFVATHRALDSAAATRCQLDRARCEAHRAALRAAPAFHTTLREVYRQPYADEASCDPEVALYSGGFIPDQDRGLLARSYDVDRVELLESELGLTDPRLAELWFRARARTLPEALGSTERARWRRHCKAKLLDPQGGQPSVRARIKKQIAERRATALSPEMTVIVDAVEGWTEQRSSWLEAGSDEP